MTPSLSLPAASGLLSAAGSAVVAGLATLLLLRGLLALPLPPQVLDQPNARSLHQCPVPRIGGLALIVVLLPLCLLTGQGLLAILLAVLALVSLADDLVRLSARLRLAVQLAVAAIWVIWGLSPDIPAAWPLWWAPLALLGSVWMTNLYNFMDGADGLAGGMTVFGFAFLALPLAQHQASDLAGLALATSAAGLAFLAFNFHPARLFMGDVGAIPLGFLAAALTLLGWQSGIWPLWYAPLVFAPFTVDASVTLLRRLLRGERIWEAHRSHYYQRLVQLGWGHRRTALAYYAAMLLCGLAATFARLYPEWLPGVMACAGTLILLALGWVDRRWALRRS